jgi:hypothetical protein
MSRLRSERGEAQALTKGVKMAATDGHAEEEMLEVEAAAVVAVEVVHELGWHSKWCQVAKLEVVEMGAERCQNGRQSQYCQY